jgi:hypothetical protein
MQNEDLFDYEKDLEILFAPFPRLKQLYRGGLRKSNNYLENSYDYGKKPVVEKPKRGICSIFFVSTIFNISCSRRTQVNSGRKRP